MLSHLMERSGLTKMVMGLETIHSETMPISVQQRMVPPISIRSKSAVKMMATVGQIIGVETSSPATLHSGMIRTGMDTVTTGPILLGTLQGIQIGQESSSRALHHPTSVPTHQQPTSMMKAAQRANEIPIKTVSTICSTIVQNNRKVLMATMMDVHYQSQKPRMEIR